MLIEDEEDYRRCMEESERLASKDPSINTPEGSRLLELIDAITTYEIKQYQSRYKSQTKVRHVQSA